MTTVLLHGVLAGYCGLSTTGCDAEPSATPPAVLEATMAEPRARDAVGAVCAGSVGLGGISCPEGYALFSEVTGTEPLQCDACVPEPNPSDPAPECYFDDQCRKGTHCEVDDDACPQPDYCGDCWYGCRSSGSACVMCYDCACGGTCEAD